MGLILDATGSWELSLMVPNICLMVAGSLAFTLFSKNVPVNFESEDNSPLPLERYMELPRKAAAATSSAAIHFIEALVPAPPPALLEAAKKAKRAALKATVTVTHAAEAMDDLVHRKAGSSSSLPSGLEAATSRVAETLATASLSASGMGRFLHQGVGFHPTLISQWTAASIMPDFDDEMRSVELAEAEAEVVRIMEDRKQISLKDSRDGRTGDDPEA